MISKENFIKIITKLRDDEDFNSELNAVFRKYNSDTQSFYDNNYTLIVEILLPQLINPNKHKELVDELHWFCLENDFGRKYYEVCATYADGTPIPLGNIEEFWDYLEKEYVTDTFNDVFEDDLK